MERGAATAKREGQLENELLRQRVHELQVLKLLVYEYLKAACTSSLRASKIKPLRQRVYELQAPLFIKA
jgi:hypothetical protein